MPAKKKLVISALGGDMGGHGFEREQDNPVRIEKTKDKKPPVSKKEVVDYISNNLTNTPEALVQLLIKKVIIYDDKVEIYYNYTNEKDTLDLLQECPFYIEQISRTIKNTKINRDDYELNFEISAYF